MAVPVPNCMPAVPMQWQPQWGVTEAPTAFGAGIGSPFAAASPLLQYCPRVQMPLCFQPATQLGVQAGGQYLYGAPGPTRPTGMVVLSLEEHVFQAGAPVQPVTTSGLEPPELDAPHMLELDDPEGQAGQEHPAKPWKTTVIIRGFPRAYSQDGVHAWLRRLGFEDLFDFLLWFPPKAASRRRHISYAFVNFTRAEQAQELLRYSGMPAPRDVDNPEHVQSHLTIMEAKVQGFAANFLRFFKLSRQTGSSAAPFFDARALMQLPKEARRMAEQSACAEEKAEVCQPPKDGTTVVIRNLPPTVGSSEQMASWLKDQMDDVQYDFLLYTPPKGSKSGAARGCGYGFVNFMQSQLAEQCIAELCGRWPADGTTELNVVMAHVQGYDACLEHFYSLLESGRCPAITRPSEGAHRYPSTSSSINAVRMTT